MKQDFWSAAWASEVGGRRSWFPVFWYFALL